MYYQNYEDYMRSVLGYPIEPNNTYAAYSKPYEVMEVPFTEPTRYNDEILNLYPEIYRVVNPMVCKICEANTKPITRELVDQMTDEIYMNLEVQPENDTIVNVRATVPTAKAESENKRNSSDINMNSSSKSSISSSNSTNRATREQQNKEVKEVTQTRELEKETRQRRPNNRVLRDLIRILILNRLLGGNFPNRPPFPPRPPMHPRPPMRPLFPREDRFYENYLR